MQISVQVAELRDIPSARGQGKHSAGANPPVETANGADIPQRAGDTARQTSPQSSHPPAGTSPRRSRAGTQRGAVNPPSRPQGAQLASMKRARHSGAPYRPKREPRGRTPRQMGNARSGNSASRPLTSEEGPPPPSKGRTQQQSDCLLNTQLRGATATDAWRLLSGASRSPHRDRGKPT